MNGWWLCWILLLWFEYKWDFSGDYRACNIIGSHYEQIINLFNRKMAFPRVKPFEGFEADGTTANDTPHNQDNTM